MTDQFLRITLLVIFASGLPLSVQAQPPSASPPLDEEDVRVLESRQPLNPMPADTSVLATRVPPAPNSAIGLPAAEPMTKAELGTSVPNAMDTVQPGGPGVTEWPGEFIPPPGMKLGVSPAEAQLKDPLRGTPASGDAFSSVPENQILSGTADPQDWTPAFAAVFEGPCHFACHPHSAGLLQASSNLVIYEGMRIEVDASGVYRLSFIAEVPDIPAVMTLQIAIAQDLQGQRFNRGSITLPPITFETETSYSRHQAGKSVKVLRQGYSPVLHRLLRTDFNDGLLFARHGSVRFGSIPPKGDYSVVGIEPTDTVATKSGS